MTWNIFMEEGSTTAMKNINIIMVNMNTIMKDMNIVMRLHRIITMNICTEA